MDKFLCPWCESRFTAGVMCDVCADAVECWRRNNSVVRGDPWEERKL